MDFTFFNLFHTFTTNNAYILPFLMNLCLETAFHEDFNLSREGWRSRLTITGISSPGYPRLHYLQKALLYFANLNQSAA